MSEYIYLTEEYEKKTKYPSIRDAIDRDYFSVVKYHGGLWLETRQCPPSIYRRAAKELRQIYPDLTFIC